MELNLWQIFISTFEKGGPVIVGFIFFVSVVAWYLGLDRYFFLRRVQSARETFLANIDRALRGDSPEETSHPAFTSLLRQLSTSKREKLGKATELYFREFLISIVPELDRGYSAMSAWISVAPLLGLLGTVMGMIKTFNVITTFGVGNPSLTAEGISVALITTQAGLTVAFPAMLLHNYLANRKTILVNKLLKDGEDLVNKARVQSGGSDIQQEKES